MSQLKKINGGHGTIVFIYDMLRNLSGQDVFKEEDADLVLMSTEER